MDRNISALPVTKVCYVQYIPETNPTPVNAIAYIQSSFLLTEESSGKQIQDIPYTAITSMEADIYSGEITLIYDMEGIVDGESIGTWLNLKCDVIDIVQRCCIVDYICVRMEFIYPSPRTIESHVPSRGTTKYFYHIQWPAVRQFMNGGEVISSPNVSNERDGSIVFNYSTATGPATNPSREAEPTSENTRTRTSWSPMQQLPPPPITLSNTRDHRRSATATDIHNSRPWRAPPPAPDGGNNNQRGRFASERASQTSPPTLRLRSPPPPPTSPRPRLPGQLPLLPPDKQHPHETSLEEKNSGPVSHVPMFELPAPPLVNPQSSNPISRPDMSPSDVARAALAAEAERAHKGEHKRYTQCSVPKFQSQYEHLKKEQFEQLYGSPDEGTPGRVPLPVPPALETAELSCSISTGTMSTPMSPRSNKPSLNLPPPPLTKPKASAKPNRSTHVSDQSASAKLQHPVSFPAAIPHIQRGFGGPQTNYYMISDECDRQTKTPDEMEVSGVYEEMRPGEVPAPRHHQSAKEYVNPNLNGNSNNREKEEEAEEYDSDEYSSDCDPYMDMSSSGTALSPAKQQADPILNELRSAERVLEEMSAFPPHSRPGVAETAGRLFRGVPRHPASPSRAHVSESDIKEESKTRDNNLYYLHPNDSVCSTEPPTRRPQGCISSGALRSPSCLSDNESTAGMSPLRNQSLTNQQSTANPLLQHLNDANYDRNNAKPNLSFSNQSTGHLQIGTDNTLLVAGESAVTVDAVISVTPPPINASSDVFMSQTSPPETQKRMPPLPGQCSTNHQQLPPPLEGIQPTATSLDELENLVIYEDLILDDGNKEDIPVGSGGHSTTTAGQRGKPVRHQPQFPAVPRECRLPPPPPENPPPPLDEVVQPHCWQLSWQGRHLSHSSNNTSNMSEIRPSVKEVRDRLQNTAPRPPKPPKPAMPAALQKPKPLKQPPPPPLPAANKPESKLKQNGNSVASTVQATKAKLFSPRNDSGMPTGVLHEDSRSSANKPIGGRGSSSKRTVRRNGYSTIVSDTASPDQSTDRVQPFHAPPQIQLQHQEENEKQKTTSPLLQPQLKPPQKRPPPPPVMQKGKKVHANLFATSRGNVPEQQTPSTTVTSHGTASNMRGVQSDTGSHTQLQPQAPSRTLFCKELGNVLAGPVAAVPTRVEEGVPSPEQGNALLLAEQQNARVVTPHRGDKPASRERPPMPIPKSAVKQITRPIGLQENSRSSHSLPRSSQLRVISDGRSNWAGTGSNNAVRGNSQEEDKPRSTTVSHSVVGSPDCGILPSQAGSMAVGKIQGNATTRQKLKRFVPPGLQGKNVSYEEVVPQLRAPASTTTPACLSPPPPRSVSLHGGNASFPAADSYPGYETIVSRSRAIQLEVHDSSSGSGEVTLPMPQKQPSAVVPDGQHNQPSVSSQMPETHVRRRPVADGKNSRHSQRYTEEKVADRNNVREIQRQKSWAHYDKYTVH